MCVVDATYKTYPVLDAFFYRTAHSISSGGVKFIASVEARSYPIFGT